MMKLLILVVLLNFCYCSENYGIQKEERHIAGGGNYGGFIGLTTYGAGPFLVKGKYDIVPNQEYGSGQEDGVSKNGNDKKDMEDEIKIRASEGYEDVFESQKRQNGEKKIDDDFESLGYDYDDCIEYYNKKNHYGNQHNYRRHGYYDDIGLNQGGGNFSRYYDDDIREKCDYVFGYTGPTANDEPENLMRPCALDDWQCIRKFFAANSKCKPAYGPIPDPLIFDINTVFHPIINITIAMPNLITRGLSSAKIRDFYVNKYSGNLVFAIDVTNFNETAPRGYFRYRRTAKESIVLADFATILLRSVTFTAVIPKVPNLRLDLADIHADIQDPLPAFYAGPGIYNSTDPDVTVAFKQLNELLPLSLRDALLSQSPIFTSIYIQKNICDFGLQVISV